MEIIKEECEALFTDLLAKIQEEPDLWMCVYIRMSSLDDNILYTEGFSQKALDQIHQVSLQLAKNMSDAALEKLEGKIFVFEDGDIVTLFLCANNSYNHIIDTLRKIFVSHKMEHVFNDFHVKEHLSSLAALSQMKTESAQEHNFKKNTSGKVEKESELSEDSRKELQKKRRLRASIIILIIDDDIVTRGLMEAILNKNYIVVHTKDAKSGIAAYITHAPNVVFLDIHLPDHNGNKVLERLKFIDPMAYVVMISSDHDTHNIANTLSKGSAGFLNKPFSKQKVLEYVSRCPLQGDGVASFGWNKKS